MLRWFIPKLETMGIAHGTTFSTLHLIGKQEGNDYNCLIPFGELAKKMIPCFAGECYRGISDNGVNQRSISGICIYKVIIAIDYACASSHKFDAKKIKDEFMEIIYLHKNHLFRFFENSIPTLSSAPPDATNTYDGFWNKMMLKLQQIRAWDEVDFQNDLRSGLINWIDDVIVYHRNRGQISCSEDKYKVILEKMKNIRCYLDKSQEYQLTEEDRNAIKKNHPIVFLSNLYPPNHNYDDSELHICERMQLGVDIRWIATTQEAINDVQNHLKMQGLENKVNVITIEALKEFIMTHDHDHDRDHEQDHDHDHQNRFSFTNLWSLLSW